LNFLDEVKDLLSQAQRQPVAVPKPILDEFLKDCKQAVEKTIYSNKGIRI